MKLETMMRMKLATKLSVQARPTPLAHRAAMEPLVATDDSDDSAEEDAHDDSFEDLPGTTPMAEYRQYASLPMPSK